MRLSRLRLVNYRRFRDAQLEFPDGLLAIVGRNGAGKSTLVEAILWAIFGHDAARTGKDLLKREAAAPGEDVVVRLDFELDGADFAVTRRLRGRSLQPEACIESSGQALVAPGANSWDQANQFLLRLLGFDRTAFESTVVAKQGEVAALSDLRPANRKRLLLGLLGIDRIDEALQEVRSDGRVADARLQEARRSLEDEPGLLAEQAVARTEHDQARDSVARLEAQAQDARRRWSLAQAQTEASLAKRIQDQELRLRLQSSQSRLEHLWGQRTRLSSEASLLRDKAAELPTLHARLDEWNDLDARISAAEEARGSALRRDELLRRDADLRDELGRLQARAGGEAPPLRELEEALAECRGGNDRTRQQVSHLEAEIGWISRRREDLAAPDAAQPEWKAEDACPTCGRRLGNTAQRLRETSQAAREGHETSLRGLAADERRLHAELATTRDELLRLETELHRRQDELQAARAAAHEREWAGAQAARVAKQLAALAPGLGAPVAEWDETAYRGLVLARAERERLRETAIRLEECVTRISKIQDEDRVLRAQEQEIMRERETASRELRAVAYEAGAWERASGELDALRRRTESLERELVQWGERREARGRDLQRLEEALRRVGLRRTEVRALQDRLHLLESLAARRGDDGLLAEFRGHLIGRIRPALARAASGLLAQMTGGRYAHLQLDEDYAARLLDRGVPHPLERFSGGEVDAVNLALRLAVSELVANARGRSRLQFVVLDEVFGSQDDERRAAILDALHGLSNVFRQVFVVTHHDDVRERVPHVVRVDEDPDGSSRFTTSWTRTPAESPAPEAEPAPEGISAAP